MAVGHVQKGELAFRREAEKVFLADRALGCGAAQPAAQPGDRGNGCCHLQEVSAGNHAQAFIGRRPASATHEPASYHTSYLFTGLSGDIT